MFDIPDWMVGMLSNTSLLQVVFWLVLIIALIVALVKLWPVLTKTVQIINSVSELPAFIKRTDDSIGGLKAQIQNDHDTNLRDELTKALESSVRTEQSVEGLHGRMDAVERSIGGVYKVTDVLIGADDQLRRDLDDTRPKSPLSKSHLSKEE